MTDHTDWRQVAASQTNQSQGRGWDFSTDAPTLNGYRRNVLPVLAFVIVVVSLIAIGSRVGL